MLIFGRTTRRVRSRALAVLGVALTGVSAVARAQTDVAPLGVGATPPAAPAFTDARPAEERKAHYLSLWRLSCEFGVRDLGDEGVDRPSQLRRDLTTAYGPSLGKAVVVEHYHLYVNQRAMLAEHFNTTGILGLAALGVGAGAKTTAPACAKEKMPEGWFDSSELTTPWSPLIAEVDLRVGDQAYKVRSVYSPPKNMPSRMIVGMRDHEGEDEAIRAAVEKADAAVVAAIRAQVQPEPAAPAPTPDHPLVAQLQVSTTPVAAPGQAAAPAFCEMRVPAAAEALGYGVVTEFWSSQMIKSNVQSTQARAHGAIDPAYLDLPTVTVQMDSGPKYAGRLPPGFIVKVGDRVTVQGWRRNPALSCNYIPNVVAADFGAAGRAQPAPAKPLQPPAAAKAAESPADRLENAQEMLVKGLITQAEYEAIKTRIIGSL